MPDLGSLDVRRKRVPEGHYKGIISNITWKTAMDEGIEISKARVQITILTDNPNEDESTKGKNVFDNMPWNEKMAWKFGAIYAAANDLTEDDDALAELTPEMFDSIKDSEVYFDVKHNTITGNDGNPRTMVNVQGYKAVTE